MKLRDRARGGDVTLYGRMLLASRGVRETKEALAGAMLEAEFQAHVVGFIRGMSKG